MVYRTYAGLTRVLLTMRPFSGGGCDGEAIMGGLFEDPLEARTAEVSDGIRAALRR
jgi:hypothetical protein